MAFMLRFRANYMKVLDFSYTVPLKVEQRDGIWHFQGEEDLGAVAGGFIATPEVRTPQTFTRPMILNTITAYFGMRRR